MFEPIISETSPQWWAMLICILVALAMGLVFAILYAKLKQNDNYFKDMPITFTLFPFIVATLVVSIMLLTGSFDLADPVYSRLFRAAGALVACFLFLRFRSFPRSFEDLTYIFSLIGCGLLAGMGYLILAGIFYAVLILVFVIFRLSGFPRISSRRLNVKITVPEDLNYEEIFDEVMKKYTVHYDLTRIKSSDMGTLFILNYELNLAKDVSLKEFLDEIRKRNGNLDITVAKKKFASEE